MIRRLNLKVLCAELVQRMRQESTDEVGGSLIVFYKDPTGVTVQQQYDFPWNGEPYWTMRNDSGWMGSAFALCRLSDFNLQTDCQTCVIRHNGEQGFSNAV